MSTSIEVEKLSKLYRLGEVSTGAIVHDLNRWWHKVRGKDDPYMKIGDTNDRSVAGDSDFVWSLRDIDFSVQQGEAVGIIGKNGAGKSTLLKILSRVTTPTTGSVKVRGRIASLLEVGTGFHPDLTGRENIFLNGAILGMTKNEIKRKFDEIVDFSGVARYIDTPVKRYSSGMYVRLAFAVAAHLESEILIVDEVLAVGDAEFQKKCLGKMSEVSAGSGRTVLFVSHNLAAIQNLCNKCLFLRHGMRIDYGRTGDVVSRYLSEVNTAISHTYEPSEKDQKGEVVITSAHLAHAQGQTSTPLDIHDDLAVTMQVKFNVRVPSAAFEMYIYTNDGSMLSCTFSDAIDAEAGDVYNARFDIPKNVLNSMYYSLTLGVSQNYSHFVCRIENAITFELMNSAEGFGWQGNYPGLIRPDIRWKFQKI